eukprot:2295974-Pyramimonas_sp.AAC.1
MGGFTARGVDSHPEGVGSQPEGWIHSRGAAISWGGFGILDVGGATEPPVFGLTRPPLSGAAG